MSKEQKSLDTLRHSASHIMAAAVLELFPETKVAIGSFIEDGFYYDFDRSVLFTSKNLVRFRPRK